MHTTRCAPQGFDPLTATAEELRGHALPPRPDPHGQPGLAALWEAKARRYRTFEHQLATVTDTDPGTGLAAEALSLSPRDTCGFERTSFGEPFTSLFVTMTVPNVRHTPSPHGAVRFRTFAGLGLLDVHVEMTVTAAGAVTSRVEAVGVGVVDLPVAPGDVLSVSMCLDPGAKGRANYVLANETSSQTVNASFDSFFPPAVIVNAGLSRGYADAPLNPLAPFGIVYFDDISAYTTGGFRSLLDGESVRMADGGATLARPQRISDFTFRVEYVGS